MFPTSLNYKRAIQEEERVFGIDIRIEHSGGRIDLVDKDIMMDSFVYTDGSQPSDDFTIGGTVASTVEFTLSDKEAYNDINLIGAKVIPTIKMLVLAGIDAHFIQPSQPSKMTDSEDKWEHIPLGQFNIDVVDRQRDVIVVKAMDNMIYLDKPYSKSKLRYPASLKAIYNDICSVGGVSTATSTFPNDDYMVNVRPDKDLTLRNVLGFVAELAGSFSKFDRYGYLKLKWYGEEGITITPDNRMSLQLESEDIGITGIQFTSPDKDSNDNEIVYVIGTDDYVLDISDNPLIQKNIESVLQKILLQVESISFTPYVSEWQGDPSLDSGDTIIHETIDGQTVNSILTKNIYKYRSVNTIEAKGLPNISRGFESSDNRVVNIINRLEKEVDYKLTNLEKEQLNATELIVNTLGGHTTRKDGSVFIHDGLLLEDSTKIWKWGLGGFGYSENGGLTYETGITANGSIIANIITANMVQTGVLKSLNDKSLFDLDNGHFTLGDELSFNGTKLELGGNTTLSWSKIGDKPNIPSKPSDIGALPTSYTPSWSSLSGKPYIPSETRITQITKDTVNTTYVNALGITAEYVYAGAIDGQTINSVSLTSVTIKSGSIVIETAGNKAFEVRTDGTLLAGRGGFKVPWNADGVTNKFSGGARWKYDDGNYIFQNDYSVLFFINGVSDFRFSRTSSDTRHYRMTMGYSGTGATIKALGGTTEQVQIRNRTDTEYIEISALDYVNPSSKIFKKNIEPVRSTLDIVKNTKVYEFEYKDSPNTSELQKEDFNKNLLKYNSKKAGTQKITPAVEKKESPKKIGFITENSPKEMVMELNEGETGISIVNTIGILWKAVQELSDKVDKLKGD